MDSGDQNRYPQGKTINLIELLNKKQGKDSQTNQEDQDSSLENNISQDSDQINQVQNDNSEIDFEHSENQNTKIHRNQSHTGAHSSIKDSSVFSSSTSKTSNKNKRGDKNNSNNSNVLTNPSITNGSNSQVSSERNNLRDVFHDGDEEEESKNQDGHNDDQDDAHHFSGFNYHEDKDDNDDNEDYQTIEDEDQEGNQHRQNPTGNRPSWFPNNAEGRSSSNSGGQRVEGNGVQPLSNLFHESDDIIVPTNLRQLIANSNRARVSLPLRNTSPRNYLDTFIAEQNARNAHLRQLRQTYRHAVRRRQNSTHCPEGFQILSSESVQNQIRYFYCAAISLMLIFCFVIYSIKNHNKIFYFIATGVLVLGLYYIFYKIKKINQIRQNQIHENNYFSYRFTNFPSENRNNNNQNAIHEDENDNHLDREIFEGYGIRRNMDRYMNSLRIFISLSNTILNQIRHQVNSAESGYNEEQLVTIGGTHKYADLKALLKSQKQGNKSDQENLGASENNQGEEEADDNSCIVCLERFDNDTDVRILKCQHFFHQICLDEWLKKKKECPVCRQCPLVVESTAEQQPPQAYPNFVFPQYPIQLLTTPSALRRNQASQSSSSNRSNRRSNLNYVIVYP